MFKRPRGTRDYLPLDNLKRKLVIEKFRNVFELYGYGEILTPAFEHLELLEAKAGPEVKEQIYWFEDKAGRKLGLRFELTTSVARVVGEHRSLPKPIKFYYIQPMWRYEEPQKGRLREFWQAGVEFIGSRSPAADAEVVALTIRALREAGIEDAAARLNSRDIIEGLADSKGIRVEDRDEFFRILDKLEKRGRDFVVEELNRIGVEKREAELLAEFISMEGSNEEKLEEARILLKNSDRGLNGIDRVSKIIQILENGYNLSDSVYVDYGIVRGLGYYTGFVFEIISENVREVGSVAGGGRYDDLIKLVGGFELPATGMSIGVERVIEVLEAKNVFAGLTCKAAKVLVAPVKSDYLIEALKIAEALRDNEISAIVDPERFKLRLLLDYADRLKIDYVIIIGEKELSEDKVTMRNMKTWEQETLKLEDAIKKILES
ncbi:MAG: histidine--tRNA ligase [Thermoprotei archaeon]|nr:MAG: histidine--tRNA ligase [Thermoprotei archaeon]